MGKAVAIMCAIVLLLVVDIIAATTPNVEPGVGSVQAGEQIPEGKAVGKLYPDRIVREFRFADGVRCYAFAMSGGGGISCLQVSPAD